MEERAPILVVAVILLAFACLVQSAALSLNVSLAPLDESRVEFAPDPELSTFGTTPMSHSEQSETSSALDATTVDAHALDTNVLNPSIEPTAVALIHIDQDTTERTTLAPEVFKIDVGIERAIDNPSEELSMVAPTDYHQDITDNKITGKVLITMGLSEAKIEMAAASNGKSSGVPSTIAPNDVNEKFKVETTAMEPRAVKVELAATSIGKSSVEPRTVAPTDINQEITGDDITPEAITETRTVKVEVLATLKNNSSGEPSILLPTDINEDKLSNAASIVAPRAANIKVDVQNCVHKQSGERSMVAPTNVNRKISGDKLTETLTMASGAVKVEVAAMPCHNQSSKEPSKIVPTVGDKEILKDKVSGQAATLNPRTVSFKDITTAKGKIITDLTTMKPNRDEVQVTITSNSSVAGKLAGDNKLIPSTDKTTNTTEDKPTGESSKIQIVILQIEDIDDKALGNSTEHKGTSNANSKSDILKLGKRISSTNPNTIVRKGSRSKRKEEAWPKKEAGIEVETESKQGEDLDQEDPSEVNEEGEEDFDEEVDEPLEEETPGEEGYEEVEEEFDVEEPLEEDSESDDRNEVVERVGDVVNSAEATTDGNNDLAEISENRFSWHPFQ